MLTPNEIEAVPRKFAKLFRELQFDILGDIVRRLSLFSDITRATDWEITRLYELGAAKSEIKKTIQGFLRISDQEIDAVYSKALEADYIRYSPIYEQQGVDFVPFEENAALQQMILGLKTQTKDEIKNITQSLGFAVQRNGVREFLPIADYYQDALDRASMGMISGAFDYNTVIKRAVRELTNSGLRTIDYETGYRSRVDVAARRALMTGFNQVVAKITEDNAEKLGTNYFEVTYHIGARPTHQPWQGRVYSKEELVSVCGYGEVDGLKGANCYHDFHPFFKGISKRVYTDEELDRMNAKENTPKEYCGKEYTTYEALQRQRRLETTLRAQRQEIKLLEQGNAAEDDILAAKARYFRTSSEYAEFSKAMGLPQQRERVSVDGIKRIEDKGFGIEVRSEYDCNSMPGKGSISYDSNYDFTQHVEETEFADWVHNNLGGDIHLLQESTKDGVLSPDYLWNGKMWELKTTSKEKAVSNAIRKGLKQINANPGGIFLNFKSSTISLEKLQLIIVKRMLWHKDKKLDIVIVNQGKILSVLRYKKRGTPPP